MVDELQLTFRFEEGINEVNRHWFAAFLVIDQAALEAGFTKQDGTVSSSSYTKTGAIYKLFEEIDYQHKQRRLKEQENG